jgi:predicted flap endonuclease-1-like 5' DNA nuclease
MSEFAWHISALMRERRRLEARLASASASARPGEPPQADQQAARDHLARVEAAIAVLTARSAEEGARPRIMLHLPWAAPARATGVADDLTLIRGIDRGTADLLVRHGVRSLAEIASWSARDVLSLSAALRLGRRIARENWIESRRPWRSAGAGLLTASRAWTPAAPPHPCWQARSAPRKGALCRANCRLPPNCRSISCVAL